QVTLTHGDAHAAAVGHRLRDVVPGVDVPDHAHAGVVGQHAPDLLARQRGAVGDRDLPGVEGAAHADAAAVVQGHPGGAGRHVDHGVEQRPVGDGVGAVPHGLGLPVRGGDGAAVEVVAADDDRGGEFAARDHVVEPFAGPVAFAVAEPADAGGQALEVDAFTGHADPAGQRLVLGEEVEDRPVGPRDVGRVAGEGGPAEGALALAEQRADVGGDEAGE